MLAMLQSLATVVPGKTYRVIAPLNHALPMLWHPESRRPISSLEQLPETGPVGAEATQLEPFQYCPDGHEVDEEFTQELPFQYWPEGHEELPPAAEPVLSQ